MDKKKNKILFIVYISLVGMVATFLVFMFLYDNTNLNKHQTSPHALEIWDDYEFKLHDNYSTISGTIEISPEVGNILTFYSVHHNIKVYIDGEQVYQYPIINTNPFASSSGYCWNSMPLPNDTNNLLIEITSPYQSNLTNVPTFYVGNTISIAAFIATKSIVPFLLCIIMFVIGICMIFFYCYMSIKATVSDKILYLGLFASMLAIYSANECSIVALILKNNIISSYISFLVLMLLPLPFALFVKNYYDDTSKIWNFFCYLDIIQIVGCILLQLFKIKDLRETLNITHIMIGIIFMIILFQSIKLLKHGIQSNTVKIHLACILICATTLIIDVFGYYIGKWDNNTFGRIGFLSYIIILGISSLRETSSLLKMGQKANIYQHLAYNDQMTGMYNRTYFNIAFDKISKSPNDVAVIDFDLNNLKYTNDTYGHSVGDTYIIKCANIIDSIFSKIGTCYRVGGDEFVALIPDSSNVNLTAYLLRLDETVEKYNSENKDLYMQISYGCTVFSPDIDKTLEDTYNRADKLMYRNKHQNKLRNKQI